MAKKKNTTRAAKTTPVTNPSNGSSTPKAPKAKVCGIEKEFLKNRPVCKVTFNLPQAAAPDAKTVSVVGEFNNWSPDATPMRRRKDNGFSVSLELEKGRSYRFRYIIDGSKYENDWAADRYQPNPYGGEDSVVDL